VSGTYLDKIISVRRARLRLEKELVPQAELEKRLDDVERRPERFSEALTSRPGPNIIAEFKRASPSKGAINDSLSPVEAAVAYSSGGAASMSILTEQDHFSGSLGDLVSVRETVDIPLLRKDFIVDEYQLFESAAAGADAVLLIVAALEKRQLGDLMGTALELGLDAVVEVHDRTEFAVAVELGARLIGVNNRDLRTFSISLNVSRELIGERPPGVIIISESGIDSREQIAELSELGFDAFLIGESLMRSGDPEAAVRTLIGGDRQ
jgi:indole-3-glycerol phosphate synthase